MYWKGLEKKEPRYFYRTYREIEKLSPEDDSNIQILYKSKNVDRVFTSYLWLWNKGKKAINASDIPPQSNLLLRLKDKQHNPNILDYRILKTSRDEVNFRITSASKNEFSVAFDFLDYNDGAVMEIQHTGSYDTEIETDGIILGVPDGIVVASRPSSNSFLGSYRRMLSRDRERRPTRLFIHKSFRQRFIAVLFYIVMFILVVGFMGFAAYSFTTSPTVNIKVDNLKELLVREAPQLTTQNIQNIIASATERSVTEKVLIYASLAYLVLFTCLIGVMAWQEFRVPVPKSLYFKDDIEGNEK